MKRSLLTALLLAFCACSVAHIDPYTPKRRNYEMTEPAPSDEQLKNGSLGSRDSPVANLFSDDRGRRLNDIVVVKVEETANAQTGADTGTKRDTDLSIAIQAFLKTVKATTPQLDLTGQATSSKQFNATGSTDRTQNVTATVPAVVRKVFANGYLFVEGHRVVLVNQEEQHFYISGLVRPIDIGGDDSVSSTKLADAEVEFTGRGVLTENQKPGLFARFFNWIWPF